MRVLVASVRVLVASVRVLVASVRVIITSERECVLYTVTVRPEVKGNLAYEACRWDLLLTKIIDYLDRDWKRVTCTPINSSICVIAEGRLL